jgi:hypothetical protein
MIGGIMESSPTKKVSVKNTQSKIQKTQTDPVKVALFAPNSIFHPSLGRLNNGYTIVDSDKAEEWLKISDKVRQATPQEVASAFEV